MNTLSRALLVAAACLLITSAVFAQDYAGSCNDCASCMAKDAFGTVYSGYTCADWSGYVPNCAPWTCAGGCTGEHGAVCENDGSGLYHYLLLHRTENLINPEMKLVSAVITTAKGTRSLRVKRSS